MRRLSILSALLLAWGVSPQASAENIHARLVGYQEVPSVSTPASGEFKAHISRDDGLIEYELSFSGLLGTVQQSHIHFGQRSVSGYARPRQRRRPWMCAASRPSARSRALLVVRSAQPT